ncbi:hypothetical protein FPQ18DRAFT_317547 [Pyronema domesticum]|nr:hypothetical protein FPQ18DRAFT_317547 [Pyronema domesticum]
MVTNSEMILMVRSASNDETSPLPFFPLQHKCSALHLLVHMVSTIVQFSAQYVLDESWSHSTKVENKIDRFIIDVTLKNYPENRDNGKQIMIQLKGLIANIRSILHLLDSQMTTLKQLRDIIKKGYHAHFTPSNGYHDSHLQLPFRLQGFPTLRVVLRELEILIAESKEHTKEFQKLIRSLEQRQTTYIIFHEMNASTYRVADTLKTNINEAIEKNGLYRSKSTEKVLTALNKNNRHRNTMTQKVLGAAHQNLGSRKSATENIVESMDKETKSVQEHKNIALMTSQTMSMFTVVTVFFLPLGFFCSVEPPHHSFDSVRWPSSYGQYFRATVHKIPIRTSTLEELISTLTLSMISHH